MNTPESVYAATLQGNVQEQLTNVFLQYGTPDYIRSDNGSEFTAINLREWLDNLEINTTYIEPGSPWENGYIESFKAKCVMNLVRYLIIYLKQELLLKNGEKSTNHTTTQLIRLQTTCACN